MVNLTIDNIKIQVPEGTTILDAAASADIYIPTLCFLKDLNEIGSCRMCCVEVEGCDALVAACNNVVSEGMVVKTNTKKVYEYRKTNLELILSEHSGECTTCVRSGNCSLQELSREMGLYELPYEKKVPKYDWDPTAPLIRDASRCIKCMRCIQICDKVQDLHIWDTSLSGSRTNIRVTGGRAFGDSDCSLCGQCITHCPVGALHERDDLSIVRDALADPDVITVVQVAPAVRSAWGESLGLTREQATEKRMAAALRRVGFDYVFDTNFSADLTIMEEGSEFIKRLPEVMEKGLPMFTSCCPGWVRFIKSQFPDMVDMLSSAKSPQQMFGAITKSYFADIIDADPKKIFCVSVMPCTAKKHEVAIPCINDADAGRDVDLSITTREMSRLLRSCHIRPETLPEEDFDSPLGAGTGAAVIFGATGGVMEAALRSAYFLVTGNNPDPDAFRAVRGLDGWKEASFNLAGTELKVAVASGLGNTRKLLNAIKAGEVSYHFVEIMACPGGCAGGGGQPIHDGQELAGERGQILYGLDKHNHLRFSHENPSVNKCYQDYLGAPLGELSHKLLHTNHHEWKMPGEPE